MRQYSVKDWAVLYETSETRKLRRLSWVPTPNKHDGNGYRRLMGLPDSGNLFTAFTLIVEVASKMPERGVLADRDGPLDAEDLSFKTGFAAEHFQRAFDILSSSQHKIQWLLTTNLLETQETLGFSPGRREGKGREGKGIEGNRSKEPPTPLEKKTSKQITPYQQFFFEWNRTATELGLPVMRAPIRDQIKKALRTRYKIKQWRDEWTQAIHKIKDCPFLLGENDRGWKVTADFFLKPETVQKILEGAYSGKAKSKTKPSDYKPEYMRDACKRCGRKNVSVMEGVCMKCHKDKRK